MRLVAIGIGLALLAAGCAGDDPADGLRITRADGSRAVMPDAVRAWCGPTQGEATDELTGPRGLYILGGERPAEGDDDPAPFWTFIRPLAAIERSERTALPEHETSGAVLFVLDGDNGNELSSSQDDASGSIEVEEWGCTEGDTVRVGVDATLGSEFGDAPPARVEGTVETVVADPPGWAD
jgi:hypothetical protein